MVKKYFSMEQTDDIATISIYGDITSWEWLDSDISAATLSKRLDALEGVNQIDVYINSYGGEVAEGLAIYNSLKRHNAKIRTFCDGFACSIASVIFMAGDERIMNDASLLMIHNAWTYASGNAAELRKQAEDLDKITQASVNAYMAHSTISEEEIKELMDNETWILPDEALSYGLASSVNKTEKENANQNAFLQLFEIIKKYQEEKEPDDNDDEPDDNSDDDGNKTPPDDDTDSGDDPDDNGSDDDPDDSDDMDDNKDDKNDDETAAEKWSGFFNAILKM